jgi:glycosyltransferase involved in cell wall biosynthesis
MTQPLRLARVVSTPFTFATLLYDQIAAVRQAGIDVTLVSDNETQLSQIAQSLNVAHHYVPIMRQPDYANDLRALWLLSRFLRQGRFDIVHSTTPKAGLLTAVAGAVARTPIRLHTYTGQRWVTLSGRQRQLLRTFDRLIGKLAITTYADSASQRQFLIDEQIIRSDKIKVLGSGSLSGVNLTRFNLDLWGGKKRLDTRKELGIPPEAVVIVFVGRVTRDKGIAELVQAFSHLSEKHSSLFLLLVGPFEPDLDPVPTETQSLIASHMRMKQIGFCSNPEQYLAASDIFCLPSYREGFGSVVVEAGAMGLPSVATSIVGLVDAVEEGKTGLLVPPRDEVKLAEAIDMLVVDTELRQVMGFAARHRVQEAFDAQIVNQRVSDEYFHLAQSRLRFREN